MKIKILCFLLVPVFIMISVSCASDKKIDTVNSPGEMTVYVSPADQLLYNPNGAVYKGVKIKGIPYYDIEEHFTKLSTELMSGGGPDIIDYADCFPSTGKLMDSGVLYDLNKIIKNDPEVKLEKYNQAMLNSGVRNGKRYLIPLQYRMSGVYTTKTIMESNGINVDITKWSLSELVQIAKAYTQKNIEKSGNFIGFELRKRDEDKYKSYDNILFIKLLGKDLSSYIDDKNKKSVFSNGKFIEFLELYKQLYPSICTDDSGYKLLKDDKAVIILDPNLGSPKQFQNLCTNAKSVLGEEIILGRLPSMQSDGVVSAEPLRMWGINAKSRYKDAAFEYIKYMMSTDFYTSRFDLIANININTDAYEKEKKMCSIGSSESFTMLDNIVKSINKSEFMDVSLCNIILNELPEFLNGKKSAEQTAKDLDVKVTLYLNE